MTEMFLAQTLIMCVLLHGVKGRNYAVQVVFLIGIFWMALRK